MHMRFAETYAHETLQSRKIRAQRAFFWARIVGLALMITIGATLRADPELRGVLMRVGMDVISKVADLQGTPTHQSASTRPQQTSPRAGNLPTARIKINRPDRPVRSLGQDDGAKARYLGNTLTRQKVGN